VATNKDTALAVITKFLQRTGKSRDELPEDLGLYGDGLELDSLEAAELSASAFKLIGTVMAANGANSFALVRRTADSQFVQVRAGDRVEGLTVSAIKPDSVVLTGAAQAIVIEADRTAAVPASPVPSRAVSRPSEPEPEPAWAGDPAPFGH